MQKEKPNLLSAKGVGITYSSMIISYILVSFIGGIVLGGTGLEDYSVLYYAVSAILPLLAMATVFVLSCRVSGADVIATAGVEKFSPVYVFVAVAVSVGMFLGFGRLNEKFAEILQSIGGVIPVGGVSDVIDTTGKFILFSVLIAVLPAMTEEIFFRGLMVRGLKNTGKSFTVFAVALCFALYHASAVQFIYQFIYGGVLTLLAIKAKSAIPSFIAHFINNFGVLVLTYFFDMTSAVKNPALIVFGVCLTVGSVLFLCFYKTEKKITFLKNERKSFFLFSSIGLVICLIVAVTGVIPL